MPKDLRIGQFVESGTNLHAVTSWDENRSGQASNASLSRGMLSQSPRDSFGTLDRRRARNAD